LCHYEITITSRICFVFVNVIVKNIRKMSSRIEYRSKYPWYCSEVSLISFWYDYLSLGVITVIQIPNKWIFYDPFICSVNLPESSIIFESSCELLHTDLDRSFFCWYFFLYYWSFWKNWNNNTINITKFHTDRSENCSTW